MTPKLTRLTGAPFQVVASGVERATLTPGDSAWMAAEALRFQTFAACSDRVGAGCDGFLYVFSGGVQIDSQGRTNTASAGTAVLIPENTAYSLRANAAGTLVLRMTTDAPAGSAQLRGLSHARVTVKDIGALPVINLAKENRRRIPFVTEEGDGSERAHGMIVECIGETASALHHHPDSESIFLFLRGSAMMTIAGEELPVAKGDVAFFGLGDPHALRSTAEGLSFLEYHTPSRYSIVRL